VITLLIIAGFLGLLMPVFGFIALFVGGLFMVSTVAGVAALVLIFLLLAAMSHIR
jgi:hypothetical protein